MSTYHQKLRPVNYAHATGWTLVSDPPGEFASCVTYETAAAANAALCAARAGGKSHFFLVPPQGTPRRGKYEIRT